MEKKIREIRENAESLYRNGDFFCSEAVVKSVVEGLGENLNHNTIAMSSGFPVGIGGAGCTCGALSGGVMSIGYFFGRSQAKGAEVSTAMRLANELHSRFIGHNKFTCCRALTKGMVKGSPEHKERCIRITGEVAQDVAEIISANRL